ncbi:uncharacterized protein ACIBXB_012072 [Morphnus guianensis]
MQVLAPSMPTSKLLLFSLLMTATSSPVSVGVISKHHVGNMQYKYRVLISPLRSAGSSNPSVTLPPPRSLCPAAPQLRQPAARLLPAVSQLPGVQTKLFSCLFSKTSSLFHQDETCNKYVLIKCALQLHKLGEVITGPT